MRRGEILGLKWSNIDFFNRIITVEKTKSGYLRKISMSSKLTEVLENAKKISKSEYVFSKEDGKPFRSFRTAWNCAIKKAGIEYLTLHSLRRTFGTRLGMLKTNVKTIQELMGHRDITMTMRYSHPTPDHKRQAIEALSQVTSIFTTDGKIEEKGKVVNIRNY